VRRGACVAVLWIAAAGDPTWLRDPDLRPSNTWAYLSPADSVSPAKPRGQPLPEFVKTHATFKAGVVRAKNGRPLRPAHTWCGLVYHPERRRPHRPVRPGAERVRELRQPEHLRVPLSTPEGEYRGTEVMRRVMLDGLLVPRAWEPPGP